MMALYILIPVLLIFIFSFLHILYEYERAVVFTLGRFSKVKGPGLIVIVPIIQKMVRMDLRTVVMNIPPQDVISHDNVSVRVNAVVYFRVVYPENAVVQVADFYEAISQLSQTTLRSVLGQHDLDEMLAERNKLNAHIQQILEEHTVIWGIKVSMVEIKDIDINETMIRAIAKQAEAERERRAKIIHADGEFEASKKLLEAAKILAQEPQSLQLRYLQTLSNIAEEKNSTIVFPVPMEFMTAFKNLVR
jgi:regulator of protease activity HflC (stomatin/prohibitin superfamily)